MKLRASNAAADQNRQNSFLIDSNRLLYSRCQLGGPRAFRFLTDLRPWRDDRQVQERSDVAYWHISDVTDLTDDVRSLGQSRPDPKTPTLPSLT